MPFLHNHSCECFKSELDLFALPSTTDLYRKRRLISGLTSCKEIERKGKGWWQLDWYSGTGMKKRRWRVGDLKKQLINWGGRARTVKSLLLTAFISVYKRSTKNRSKQMVLFAMADPSVPYDGLKCEGKDKYYCEISNTK